MLYMKEMRAKVVAECTLKESAAINQILGRRVSGAACRLKSQERAGVRAFSSLGRLSLRFSDFLRQQWHSLSREEQAKYYELARKERQLHSQLYPGWSARDNYVSDARSFSGLFFFCHKLHFGNCCFSMLLSETGVCAGKEEKEEERQQTRLETRR